MDVNAVCRHWWGCIYDQYEHGTEDVKLLLDLIGPAPRNVFEACCGTGRVLVPLAQAGHSVAGMDADEGMLARLPAKAEGLENLRYSLDDALRADWGGGYDVVVLGDNTLMNIEHRDDDQAAQRLFIQKAAGALKPGGHFFLAFDHYPAPEKVFIGKSKLMKGHYGGMDDMGVSGQIFNCGGLYNPVTRIAVWASHTELTMPDGEKHIISGHGHKYVCTREDVHGWLKDAGFVIEEEFGGCDRRPFAGKPGWDILWARKAYANRALRESGLPGTWENIQRTRHPDAAKAVEYLESHWREDFDPEAVARSVNMSVRQLYNLFSHHVGMAPKAYHQKCKVEHIREKLADKNLTIAEAFAACGEDSRGWLRKVFREMTGMSPREYRANLK